MSLRTHQAEGALSQHIKGLNVTGTDVNLVGFKIQNSAMCVEPRSSEHGIIPFDIDNVKIVIIFNSV